MIVVSGTTILGGSTVSAGQTFTVVIDPDTALEEIVDVTAVSSNTFTITRGIDGSTGQDHSAGAVVRHMIIGRDLREANTHIETAVGVHGIAATSSVVGTLDTQTLTNKTLTAPILTGAGVDASIIFEGATADAYETTLTVVDPTADRTITLPNTSGTVVLKDSVDTLTNKTLTSPTISGSPVITGLSSAGMSASSAAPKDYVDAVLILQTAQATAAATSATSAAASATAAATSATSASVSATAATTSASSAATSATSAAASVSSISAYASAASTSATSAAASATAAATSATSAAASASSMTASVTAAASSATAAATSATSAAASATAAATSATSAAASATAAVTSATSAAASATAATTSASSAQTSQSAAATSATSAAASATAAATSATSAAASATSAASSATDAATTYDNFDDRYLGSKTSAPTVDNDGNTLLVGAIYWNSTAGAMYVWSGSTWVQIATTSVYSAPTLGSQTIASGTTYTNIAGLTINSTTIPTSKTIVVTTDKLSALAATTSAEFAGVISDETGSGALVFATSPTLVTPVLGVATATSINGTTIPSSKTLVATDSTQYVVPSQTGNSGKYLTTDGTTSSWGTVTSYSAPTIGSTSIGSGATVTTINGLTKIVSTTYASLDASGYEVDIALMQIMGAY